MRFPVYGCTAFTSVHRTHSKDGMISQAHGTTIPQNQSKMRYLLCYLQKMQIKTWIKCKLCLINNDWTLNIAVCAIKCHGSVCFLFSVCPSPCSLFSFLNAGKPKMIPCVRLKTRCFTISKTLLLGSPLPRASSASLAVLLDPQKQAERKGWWACMGRW